MGAAGAVVEISSDDEAIPVAAKRPNVPPVSSSHPLPEDCNGVEEGLGDPAALVEFVASMLDDKRSARDVAAADDGDDDDCVMLDVDPDKAVLVVNEQRPGQGGPEEELQIVSEKGEIACRDFPHPRHLCVSMPFTSSHADHCAMCHCYVCDSPAPCAFWGKGTEPTDHCHATDKNAKWTKMRQSLKRKNLPSSNRRGIKNHFQPISATASLQLQQYTGDRFSVPRLSPLSPVGFHVSRNVSQNQWMMKLIGVPPNVGQPVNLQEATFPRASIPRKRFRSDGSAPPVHLSTNANHLRHPAPNSVLVQPVSSAAFQTTQSQPASSAVSQNSVSAARPLRVQTTQSQPPSSAVSQNSVTAARPLRGYSPQNSFSAPVRVQSTSYHQVAPGISQGLQVQSTSYLQVDPGRAVSAELQLSQCSSLQTQGIQHQHDPSADIYQNIWKEALAKLASELGVSDYNIDPPGRLPSTPQPNQLHAQMRPGHQPTQATARQGVQANGGHVAAASQKRTSNGHHLPNHKQFNPGAN
ncbi:uncharacterized protein LOC127767920 [Oryza glaberrima]|uniref:RPM1 interacting protein 13 n=2 Tax=Oryza TaxID=4527 RepID=A0A0D3FDM3_9ORYZ|nr:uncharacterized protein LOC127767920 [Oryza glaberrima]XP_052149368.1 uncharacterized protein LOC127767920 [Oryza glaberrima]